ncbi:DeoR/GlpR family DNA-binding transcription regulator [Leptolinea tardivitalis]|uniref:Lactose phosphotransferase system repressor n=1 Tax=Leptolinea tardivitalis TaxID=229920 RepID=A0A0P6XP73_9CHLR|nr:DeoR/GlpR family DNA-binding transcription regulator [Leptolinea tardivitalis]KPL70860.1 DeoR faimly transcriptional regulator [Leptolinea tardivitalis]GAP20548.1 transcriptional regulator, DeoR family [Leptolinea tardivitalis]
MLKEERQQIIMEKLRHEGKIVAVDLSAAINVSEDTIRRDLRDLADAGLIQRVHGGALLRSPAGASYKERQFMSSDAKMDIARAAVSLVQNRQVIILDGGTTTLEIARRLPIGLHATVVTNSPPIAVVLADYPDIQTVMVGGHILSPSLVTIGAATVEAFSNIHADLCMLGVCSLHPEMGVSTPDYEESLVKRIMVTNSAEVAALVTVDKLGTGAPYTVAPISDLTYIITEADTSDDMLQPYSAKGITIMKGKK